MVLLSKNTTPAPHVTTGQSLQHFHPPNSDLYLHPLPPSSAPVSPSTISLAERGKFFFMDSNYLLLNLALIHGKFLSLRFLSLVSPKTPIELYKLPNVHSNNSECKMCWRTVQHPSLQVAPLFLRMFRNVDSASRHTVLMVYSLTDMSNGIVSDMEWMPSHLEYPARILLCEVTGLS